MVPIKRLLRASKQKTQRNIKNPCADWTGNNYIDCQLLRTPRLSQPLSLPPAASRQPLGNPNPEPGQHDVML